MIANLGVMEFDRADYAAAERYGRQALEMRRKLGGDQHPDVASSLIDVAMARSFQGDPASAEPLARQALAIRKTRLEAGDPDILAQVRLGEILTWEGKAAEAEPVLRAAMESPQHPPFPLVLWQVSEAGNALGACLISLHHAEEGCSLSRAGPVFKLIRARPFAGWLTAKHPNLARLRDEAFVKQAITQSFLTSAHVPSPAILPGFCQSSAFPRIEEENTEVREGISPWTSLS